MAVKKIQIIPEGTDNYGTILHPETSADNIIGQGIFGTATGTNAYAVTMLTILSLAPGTRVTVKFTNANTGASTLNVSKLGAKSIRKANGATLTAGNIKAGGVYTLVYDGVNFILQGEGGEYGTATAANVLAGKTIGTESGIITGTMPNRGNLTNTITTQGGSYIIPAGYHAGGGKVTANLPNVNADDIRWGVDIGGIVGNVIEFKKNADLGSSFGVAESIVYGNGVYVMTGDAFVATSPNGITWTKQSNPFSRHVYDVIFKNGMFIAVGGMSRAQIATSPNGVTWTLQYDEVNGNSLNAIAYGNGIYVATNGETVVTSPNGTSWTKRSSLPDNSSILGITFGNGLFVAVGESGYRPSKSIIYTSPNGVTWTSRYTSGTEEEGLKGVIYGNGLFVAVGKTGVIYTSPNGTSWTKRESTVVGASNLAKVAYGKGLYVAVGRDSVILTSPNGVTWTQAGKKPFPVTTINCLGYVNNSFLAISFGTIVASLP